MHRPGNRQAGPDWFTAGDAQAMDNGIRMYAGWFGQALWADSPAKASIIHFGGPLEPRLLREKEFVVNSGVRRLECRPSSRRAWGALALHCLSEFAILSTPIHVRIESPVAVSSPRWSQLTSWANSCYWEYYDSKFANFPQGKGIIDGTATVTIELPDGKFPLPLRKNKIEVPVRMTELRFSRKVCWGRPHAGPRDIPHVYGRGNRSGLRSSIRPRPAIA